MKTDDNRGLARNRVKCRGWAECVGVSRRLGYAQATRRGHSSWLDAVSHGDRPGISRRTCASYLQTAGKKNENPHPTLSPSLVSLFLFLSSSLCWYVVAQRGRPVFRRWSNKMDKVIFAGLCVYYAFIFPCFLCFTLTIVSATGTSA